MAGDGNEAVQGLPGTDVAQPEGDPPIVGPEADLRPTLPGQALRRIVPHCSRHQPLPNQMKPQLTGVERDAAISMDYLLAMDIPASELERIMLRVREAMAARQALGREKYPTTLAENHAPFEERVRHAWEEALDGLAYSQWMFWGWKIPRPDNPAYNRSGQDYEAGAAMRCVRLFSQALAELDALMRHCNMDPVRKEGQP